MNGKKLISSVSQCAIKFFLLPLPLQLLSVMAFCANSLGLQISSKSGVMTSTQLPIAEKRYDLRTELVAPLASSLSNYYQPPSLLEIELLKQRQNQLLQPQTLAQLLGLQNQQLIVQQQQSVNPAAPSPFLYLGQLTSSDPGDSSSSRSSSSQSNHPKRRSDESDDAQNQEKSSYELYRPRDDEYAEYVDMLPPPEEQEPNYYTTKPRKLKKYSDAKKKKSNVRRAAVMQKEVFSTNSRNNNDQTDSLTETSDYVEQSAPTSRLDFSMHGN